MERIDFSLPRMGLITGRITDETGEPIEGVSVYAMRLMYFEGQRKLVPVGSITRTDDIGEFRILRLAPGTYFVKASIKETWTVTENGKETEYLESLRRDARTVTLAEGGAETVPLKVAVQKYP